MVGLMALDLYSMNLGVFVNNELTLKNIIELSLKYNVDYSVTLSSTHAPSILFYRNKIYFLSMASFEGGYDELEKKLLDSLNGSALIDIQIPVDKAKELGLI